MMTNKSNTFTIKDWDASDRPREKLRLHGVQSLSNAELLAIIIGSGVSGESAVDLMKRLLGNHQQQLHELYRISLSELQKIRGIGKVKAVKIKAALALGVRMASEGAQEKPTVSSSQAAFELLQNDLYQLDHEQFWILYLNRANRLIEKRLQSKGGIAQTVVDIRLVMKRALENSAVSLIVAHNHPSGNLKPSQSDRQLTQKIQKAASYLDITVLDHLILSEKTYFSFADNQLL